MSAPKKPTATDLRKAVGKLRNPAPGVSLVSHGWVNVKTPPDPRDAEVADLKADNARLHEALSLAFSLANSFIVEYGVDHDLDCPEDDTCECPEAANVNKIMEKVIAALARVGKKE